MSRRQGGGKRKAEGIIPVHRPQLYYAPSQQTILLGYTEDQYDKNIRTEDVVRAKGFFYTEDEIKGFHEKSRAKAPTYGNCVNCWKCGPLAAKCSDCEREGATGYYSKMYAWRNEIPNTERYLIDAEYLAEWVGQGQEIPKANRLFNWKKDPEHYITRSAISAAIRAMHEKQVKEETEELVKRIFYPDEQEE